MRIPGNAGRRAAAAALASAAVLGVASACSSSGGGAATAGAQGGGALGGLSADQIASRATADLKVVSSVHVKGSVKRDRKSVV